MDRGSKIGSSEIPKILIKIHNSIDYQRTIESESKHLVTFKVPLNLKKLRLFTDHPN